MIRPLPAFGVFLLPAALAAALPASAEWGRRPHRHPHHYVVQPYYYPPPPAVIYAPPPVVEPLPPPPPSPGLSLVVPIRIR